MLTVIGLVMAGFALGVALTIISAGYIYGLLHEKVRAMLAPIGLIAAGFTCGVALTFILAGDIRGRLHDQVARVADSHAGIFALTFEDQWLHEMVRS